MVPQPERMLGKVLESGESTILIVDLRDGEIAETQVPLGYPGLLIADGKRVPFSGGRPFPWGKPMRLALERTYWAKPPRVVHWRKRLEWHLVNGTDREVFFGLRYTVYPAKEVEALAQEGLPNVAQCDEPLVVNGADIDEN